MRGRVPLAAVTVLALLSSTSSALAAPSRPMASPPPPAAHSDADGNGLSDALEMFLADRGGDDKIEVVVTWTGPVDLAGAGAAVGHFEVSHEFRIISGFVAEMSPAQARALSRVPGVFRVEENFVAYATNEEANQDYGTAQA